MLDLSDLKLSSIEKRVFDIFCQISKIPRGSGNRKGIAAFCEDFAKRLNLQYIRDNADNVVIFKNGSFGLENAEPIILQGHLDMANLAVTNCGTRGKKLELITTRLMSQKTNFETLESENENVDITEVAIQLSSAELTYEAALMATGKIMKTSLMDYI